MRRPAGQGLHRFACLTAAAAFFLLIAGGLVTSTDSGLAVPDWPLSYGQFFPPMVGGILFEHGHRMIAGAVGLLTLVLSAWVWRFEPRAWVRALAVASAGGIILQAILGGLTVLLLLPAPVSIAHACLGQAVFCLLLSLAQVTAPWYLAAEGEPGGAEEAGGSALWGACAAAAGAVYLQLIFGAHLRHTGRGLGLHLLGAALSSLAAVWASGLCLRRFRHRPLLTPAGLLAGLLPAQLLLGLGSYLVRARPNALAPFWRACLPTAHLACGALMLGTAVVLSLRAHRALR